MPVPHRAFFKSLCSFLNRPHEEDEGDLLRRFVCAGDEGAFAELLHRHGPMVLGLCRRVVGEEHAAEDVFQATFLTLARRAGSIRRPEALAAWLHGVAFRLAVRVCRTDRRRRTREAQGRSRPTASPLDELSAREALAILDEELQVLPEKQRLPLLLCCLEGLSQEEAARRLGCTAGSVKGQLERGRIALRRRLVRRGLTRPAALAGVLLAEGARAGVPTVLARSTVRAALTGEGASPAVLALLRLSMRSMLLGRLMAGTVVLLLLGVLSAGFALQVRLAALPVQQPVARQAFVAVEEPVAAQRPDRNNEPLPEGARLRLGTLERRAVDAQLTFADGGRSIIGVRGGRYVSVWDAATGHLRQTRVLPTSTDRILAFSPDGRFMVIDDPSQAVEVWDLQTGKRQSAFVGLRQTSFVGGQNRQAIFSPDGKRLAALGYAEQETRLRLWEVGTGKELRALHLPAMNGPFGQLAFSPDGTRLLLTHSSSGHGTFCWESASGQLLWQSKEFVPPTLLCTHDGKLLSEQEDLPAIDLVTGRRVPPPVLPPLPPRTLPWYDKKDALCIAPDGKVLFVARPGGVLVWDLVRGREMHTLAGAGGDLLPAPDGKSLLTNQYVLQRWDLVSGKPIYPDTFKKGHVDEVTHVLFSANGHHLISGSLDGTVRLWDTATGTPLRLWQAHPSYAAQPTSYAQQRAGVHALDLTPDGRRLLSAGADPNSVTLQDPPFPRAPPMDQLRFWEANTDKETRSVLLPKPKHPDGALSVFHARLAPDGSTATALFGAHQFHGPGLQTSYLAQWDLGTGRLLYRHTIALADPKSSTLAPNGTRLVSKGVVLDVASGRELMRLEGMDGGESGTPLPCAFSADGLLVASDFAQRMQEGDTPVIGPGGVHVWEVATGNRIARVKTDSWVTSVAFHPDARYLAVNDHEGVRLWDLRTGAAVFTHAPPEVVRSRETRGYGATCLAFSPDGRRLATGHVDSTILLWDVPLPAQRPAVLAKGDLEALVNDLGAAEASRAWRAVWQLADLQDAAVPMLRARLQPIYDAPAETTGPLLVDLGHDSFARRAAATRRLQELGHRAEPALRTALQARQLLETKQRLEKLLAALDPTQPPGASSLAEQRALAVVERIGSAAARQILAELAAGLSSAPLTQQAKAALRRLR